MVKCEICGKEFKNLFGLSKHIVKIHNVNSEDYYLKYIGSKKYCLTCNKETKFKNIIYGYQDYCSSFCCNNDIKKKNNISKMREQWWKNSPNVEETKEKISTTIKQQWQNKNSAYHKEEYRNNLSCSLKNRWNKWRNEDFKTLCNSYGFEIVNDYEHAHKICKFKCLECGKEFETIWNYLQSGKSCPYCFPNGVSKEEIELYEFIKKNINKEIITNTKKVISPKELDIFIPDLNIAIEYNGLWSHSANCEWGKKDRTYHLNKTLECENKNIRLIHIFEDEWIFKKDIVKHRLLNILNVNKSKVIYARNCTINILQTLQKNDFLNKYHLQGADSCHIKLGAFYNNELVAVMTFSKGKISKGSKSKENVWELSRFCVNYNYRIPGIASKLLMYFKRNYNWEQIFSYADRRWSNGNLYYKLGFNFISFTTPNYWYLKNYKRVHRFSLRKREDEPKELTEFQIRLSQGYNWIWDCGNYKFSMINNGGQ